LIGAIAAILPLATVLEAVVAVAIVALPVVAIGIVAIAVIAEAVVAIAELPVVAIALVRTLIAAFAPPLVALIRTLIGALILPLIGALVTPSFAAFAFGGLALGLLGGGAFVLEIDVEAGDELVAADDVGHRALRLHGAHDPEIVLGVLQVVLGQDPVAGRLGVAGELLVLLINVLGGAAHLHAVGPVRIERPVYVVLRLAAAAATAATTVTVAVTLALYTFEISHSYPTCCGIRSVRRA
jgi:hypothetical protein